VSEGATPSTPSTNGHGPGTPGGPIDGGNLLAGLSEAELEPLGPPGGGTTGPKMLVPLFVVPLLIVAVIVGVFFVVGRVVSHEKTIPDLISEIQSGGANERWQAAAHLSEIAVKDPARLADPALRAQLRRVFEVAGPDDTRLRGFLAELWGEIGDAQAAPILAAAVAKLNGLLSSPGGRDGGMGEKISGELIYDLCSLGRLGIEPTESAILSCAKDPDAGVRTAVASALGDFGRPRVRAGGKASSESVAALLALHADDDAWVAMNAALALAKLDRAEGLPTLEAMLGRDWLRERRLHFPDDGHFTVVDNDPAAVVMVSALLSIGHLIEVGVLAHDATADPALRRAIEAAGKDPNPMVQERAGNLLNKLGT